MGTLRGGDVSVFGDLAVPGFELALLRAGDGTGDSGVASDPHLSVTL